MYMNPEKNTKPSGTHAKHDAPSGPNLRAVAHFFFEMGMLKRTARSGFQFLGSGKESVADHSFRVAVIGFALARLSGHEDPYRVVCLCLFHDMAEARTGDMNYVNKQYVTVHEDKAVRDLTECLSFGEELRSFIEEYREGKTQAARLAHDADQLDLLLELKQQQDLGNAYATQWIRYALERLQTPIGREAARVVLETDSAAWWFDGHDDWWTSKHRGCEKP